MTVGFLQSYSLLVIRTCHKRGVHAMGGMAAQIPIKNNPEANDAAMQKVWLTAAFFGTALLFDTLQRCCLPCTASGMPTIHSQPSLLHSPSVSPPIPINGTVSTKLTWNQAEKLT